MGLVIVCAEPQMVVTEEIDATACMIRVVMDNGWEAAEQLFEAGRRIARVCWKVGGKNNSYEVAPLRTMGTCVLSLLQCHFSLCHVYTRPSF